MYSKQIEITIARTIHQVYKIRNAFTNNTNSIDIKVACDALAKLTNSNNGFTTM